MEQLFTAEEFITAVKDHNEAQGKVKTIEKDAECPCFGCVLKACIGDGGEAVDILREMQKTFVRAMDPAAMLALALSEESYETFKIAMMTCLVIGARATRAHYENEQLARLHEVNHDNTTV